MWSPDDPSNRMPMIWRDLMPYDDPEVVFDEDLFSWYRRLIALRRGLPALQHGFFRTLIADDKTGVLAYARDLDNQHVYVVLNRSAEVRTIELELAEGDRGVEMIDWLDPAQAKVRGGRVDAPAGRPRLVPVEGAGRAAGPVVAVELGPYESAVLSDGGQMR